jgi:hypothetical protein|tara:strand:- start:497 stop:772 length:276 start_codon:yes stop_codon:yes gene_type:complete
MAKELNEDTGFTISVKTLIAIGFAISTIIGMWFALQADIAEAKELPKPDVSRMEFKMKDENIRNTIMETRDDVKKLEERMIRMEDKIDKLR